MIKYLLIGLFSFSLIIKAQSESDSIIIEVFKRAQESNWGEESKGETVIRVAEFFMGTKYVGGTLDRNEREELVINLLEQDCTTFLEYVMTFTQCIHKQTMDIQSFEKELSEIRYRCPKIDDYLSRLHYFSDWIYDNVRDSSITNITKEVGGVIRSKQIDFMSSHVTSYKHLKTDEDIQKIKLIEDSINQRTYHYIPQDQIDSLQSNIPQGALIALTTSIKGLDMVHVGFAYRKENNVYLLHASSDFKKVVLSEKTLSDYVKSNKSQDGIMVLELL